MKAYSQEILISYNHVSYKAWAYGELLFDVKKLKSKTSNGNYGVVV